MPGTQLTPYIHSNEGSETINSLTSEKAHQKCSQHHGWMRTYPLEHFTDSLHIKLEITIYVATHDCTDNFNNCHT